MLGTTLIGASGTWSIDPAGNYLSEGLNTLSVKATDPAGNQSLATTVTVTLDTIAPAVATAALTASAPSDSGVLGDALTNNASPAINGTGNVGDTITLYASNGTTVLGTALVGVDGAWSIDPSSNYLSEGLNTLSVKATDLAGNQGAASTVTVTLDTIQPLVATAGLTASMPSDTGILGDAITSNPGPSISGTGNPGDTITLFAADGTTLMGTALVDAAGTWSITPAGNYLIEGLNTFSVRATDPAGNTGAARSIALILDRSLPTVVVMDESVRSELLESNNLNPTDE